jgi:transcriptional regulator with XRE-family HTH domain
MSAGTQASKRVAKVARAKRDAEPDIGSQIRELRKIKGFTLQQMADQVSVSIGFMSQIERNRSKLPIGLLKKISDVLGVHMNWFFAGNVNGPPEERDFIVRAGNRRRMSFTGTGISEELLSPNLTGPLEMLLSTIDVGADSDFYSHEGAEAGYVLRGSLELWIGKSRFDLEEGDSFSFRSTTSHRCRNTGSIPAQVVWVITPPKY